MSKAEVVSMEIADGFFANYQAVKLEAMEREGTEHDAFVAWFSDSHGNPIGKKYCSCKSGKCSKSGYCDNGNINCDCVRCTFSCT